MEVALYVGMDTHTHTLAASVAAIEPELWLRFLAACMAAGLSPEKVIGEYMRAWVRAQAEVEAEQPPGDRQEEGTP